MKNTAKISSKSLVLDKDDIKRKAIETLRSSFEIEGVYFSDEQIQEMVAEVATA
jgi:hypothetical protein